MSTLLPPQFRSLCRVDAIPDSGAIGFPGGTGYAPGLIAVRLGDAIQVYENACPHIGTPLDWVPGQFFSRDGRHLICSTHGAAFLPATGECINGPCRGAFLTVIASQIRDGVVMIDRP
jgi:nitrite reductase/ring-hydroxylating ferredoxin subunit